MKTVCPKCLQKYEIPDDYLQQEVSCEKCQHDFFVTKAKFCLECGKANPSQAFQCHFCQHSFQAPTFRTPEPFVQSSGTDANDRSEAKIGCLMNFIVALGTLSYALAFLHEVFATNFE
jgi:hypothetical protein